MSDLEKKSMDQIPELKEKKNFLGRWASFFINRYRITFLMIAAILIWGFSAYSSLPRELQPEVTLPYGSVMTTYVGAAPEEIEKLITDKIEKKLDELEDVKNITSSSGYGYSSIYVEFEQGVDMDDKVQKMRDKVSLVQSELPDDAEVPVVSTLETNNSPIMIINISGEYDFVALKNMAESIKNEIEKMKEISDVQIIGGLEREIKVIVDPQKLSVYNISLEQIKNAIASSNINFPGGDIELDHKNFNIRTVGEIEDVEELNDIIVMYVGNSPLFLRDIASIEDGYKEPESYSRMSKGLGTEKPYMQKSVAISVKKKKTADIIQTSNKIYQLLENGKGNFYPKDLQVKVSGDLAEYVKDSLGDVINNAKGGLLLVIIVLFLFIGFMESIVVSIVIPLSIFITIGMMKATGMTLNTMSLFSMLLAVGMLVDNGIVIMENVDRLRNLGLTAKSASEVGTNQIAPAVAASTLTTLAAFFPIMLTSGIMGAFIETIPKTVMIALSASFLVAVTITPSLCTIALKKYKGKEKLTKNPVMDKALKVMSIVFVFVLTMYAFRDNEAEVKFGILSYAFAGIFSLFMAVKVFARKKSEKDFMIISTYGKVLYHIVSSRWKKLTVVGVIFLLFVGSLMLIPLGILKVEMFGAEDYKRIYVNIEAPKGTNLDTTLGITAQIEERLFDFPEIDKFVSNVGITGADSYDSFSNGVGGTPNMARIIVDLYDKKKRERTSMEIAQAMRENLKGIPGAKIEVEELKDGPPTGRPVEIRVVGENIEHLKKTADDFQEILKDIPGTLDVKNSFTEGSPAIEIKIDKKRSSSFGLDNRTIALGIRNAVHGLKATVYRNNQDEIDVMIRTTKDKLSTIKDLEKVYFYSMSNQPVAFSQVAQIVETKSISSIGHENLKRRVWVSAALKEGRIAGDIVNTFKEKIKNYPLPKDVLVEYGGEEEDMQESFRDMFINMIIAAILVFTILAVQFNSLSQPLIILFTVPMAMIGVMPGLALTGNTFGFVAFIGVVALVGIAVNDAIVLVDYINYLRKNGYELKEAVKETGMTRFMPVMATTITTVGGILPMTLKNAFYAPMGYALIFGLCTATVLTLIVVPVLYTLAEGFKIKRKMKKNLKEGKNIEENIDMVIDQ